MVMATAATLRRSTGMDQTPSQLTAPNQAIDAANGVRYAYRRFGDASTAAPPLRR
jgi:hypothetical protein